ncbi:hypothetical protein COLO4_33770 [Corchorus olitorius]|uniref:Uncharacterized protein n=1 Tax=Corchorus olitorius TaxID=93759 RepID=A0A1R3GRI1_9ROSI|nr:hypothetical protein COLO4_33770 [Corchorus olitorius]
MSSSYASSSTSAHIVDFTYGMKLIFLPRQESLLWS